MAPVVADRTGDPVSKLLDNPRIIALFWTLGGLAVLAGVMAIGGLDSGGRSGGKAIFLAGMGGIAAGVGLTQIVWPPKPSKAGDERSGWARAHWLQKVLWVIGGCIGVVAAAVIATLASGKY